MLPREKASALGIDKLTDWELLGLLFGRGTIGTPVCDFCQQLLTLAGGLEGLSGMSFSELTNLSGVKQARALALLAVFEIGRRLKFERVNSTALSATSENLYQCFRGLVEDKEQEHFVVVFINTRGLITGHRLVSIGTVDCSLVNPGDVFREAIRFSAPSIAIIHNHPSGNPTPSTDDFELTKNLEAIGKFLNVRLVDHIIVGAGRYASLKKALSPRASCCATPNSDS